jgi:predicted nicotinamide N-methyase
LLLTVLPCPIHPIQYREAHSHASRFRSPAYWHCAPVYRDPALRIAGHTWPGSLALLSYLAEQPALLHDKRILELGAGTGVLGIGCHALLRDSGDGHAIVVTDLPSAVPLLNRNIELNGASAHATARALDWADVSGLNGLCPPFDVVLMAEVAYLPEVYPALASVVRALCGPRTLVLHGYQRRDSRRSDLFFEELAKVGVSCADVTSANVAAQFASSVRILQHSVESSGCEESHEQS